ncbi:MAG: AraC family transcriptional regulator [Ignavibacteriales bacterium]|nr:AraC family transcriptional regulator [Ignavibacteriales bacterium]
MKTKQEISLAEYKARINRVIKFIDDNLNKDLSLEVLANAACFSQFHFHRIFNSIIGETPGDFVKRLRIEKAANYLTLFPNLSITEIAFNCGFSSSASFARAFKEHFGLSATKWKENGYKNISSDNSKNSKTVSKNRKDKLQNEKYFSSVNNLTTQINLLKEIVKPEIKKMPALHLAYVAHLKGYNKGITDAYDKLCRWAGPRGYINQDSLFVGISLDDPEITPENKCRYYACITVPQEVAAQGEINIIDIPETNSAVFRFKIKEEEIKAAYDSVFKDWLPTSGYQPDNQYCYEIYYGSADKNPENKYDMAICLPVKPL